MGTYLTVHSRFGVILSRDELETPGVDVDSGGWGDLSFEWLHGSNEYCVYHDSSSHLLCGTGPYVQKSDGRGHSTFENMRSERSDLETGMLEEFLEFYDVHGMPFKSPEWMLTWDWK